MPEKNIGRLSGLYESVSPLEFPSITFYQRRNSVQCRQFLHARFFLQEVFLPVASTLRGALVVAIFADSLSQIMSRLIAINLEGGLMVVVLACLLQLLNYRNKLKKATAKTETAEGDLLEVGQELSDVRRDRMMSRLESRILREFIAQKNIEESISLLLRRYVPNQQHGFCLLVQFREGRESIIRGRGINEESQQSFQLDLILRERLRKERCIFLEGENAQKSPLVKSLSREDQVKVRKLHLIASGNSEELSYALVTTDLYPAGGNRTQQQELAKKLMVSVSENFTMMQDFQRQQSELQMTHERLKLQSIADSNFCSPTEMMNAFLLNLQKMMNVDRIALHLAEPNENAERTALCRCGTKLQSGARVRWENHEQRIVEVTAKQQPNTIQVVQYDRKDLAQIGVGTLIGRALVSRLQKGDSTLATICCTRSRYDEFTLGEIQLAQWAGSYLAEIIQRWQSLIEIERQANETP